MTQNLVSKFSYRIKKQTLNSDEERNQPVTRTTNAFLGDNNGVLYVLNGRRLPKNYVVVRDYDGNLSAAYNRSVPNWPNTPVLVGYDPLKPTTYQVLAARDYVTNTPTSSVPSHHETHEWPASDTVWVRGEQYLPGLIAANNGFIVKIYPFFFKKNDGTRAKMPFQTLDLSSYVPTSGAQAFTLAAGDDDLMHVIEGRTKGSIGQIQQSDFPVILDPTMHEMWGVQLYAGQSKIRMNKEQMDVFDFRGGGSGGGGMGHVILDPLGTEMGQRPYLKFSGAGVSVQDYPSEQQTSVLLQNTFEIEFTRKSALAGDDTFDLDDTAYQIIDVQINGQSQDPISYTFDSGANQVVLDTPLLHDSVVLIRYILGFL